MRTSSPLDPARCDVSTHHARASTEAQLATMWAVVYPLRSAQYQFCNCSVVRTYACRMSTCIAVVAASLMPAAGTLTTSNLWPPRKRRDSSAPAQRGRVHRRIPQSLRLAVEHRYGDRGAGHVEGGDIGTSQKTRRRDPRAVQNTLCATAEISASLRGYATTSGAQS